MDAIELLKKDHAKVTELFQRFNDGGGLTGTVRRLTGNAASPRERRSTAERICDELDVHARIEEEVFYPAVRQLHDEELEKQTDEAVDEHGTIKERVKAARAALDNDEQLKTRVSSLQECVDHHVREEENEMFPMLEDRMPESERARIGRTLAERKRVAAPRARKTTKPAPAPRKVAPRRTRKTTAKARGRARTTKKASSDRRR